MARRNSRRSAVSLSTSTLPHFSASTRSRSRTKTACVQSCHRSAGSRAFRQQVWQYLLMSVIALELGSLAVTDDALAAALAGLAASAVPSTTATITLREDRFEGRYLVIRFSEVRYGMSCPLYRQPVRAFSLAEKKNLQYLLKFLRYPVIPAPVSFESQLTQGIHHVAPTSLPAIRSSLPRIGNSPGAKTAGSAEGHHIQLRV